MFELDLQLIVDAAKSGNNTAYPLIENLDFRRFSLDRIVEAAIAAKEEAFEIGGIEIAERLLLEGIAHHPPSVVSFYELAIVYRHKYNLSRALFYVRKALDGEPNDPRTQIFFLHMLYANRLFIEAEKFFSETVVT
jgi:tetratricopeptide (TPR) repeat protein